MTKEQLRAELREEFPRMSERNVRFIADVNTAGGRTRGAELCATAYIRHYMTDYDKMLANGMDKREARRIIRPKVDAILESWRGPREKSEYERECEEW